MQVTDMSFLLLGGAAALFAGISKGGFGSGAAFASASILALVVEPGLALGVMLPVLMLIDLATLRPYWGKWHVPSVLPLILGALPGVVLGAWLYKMADPDVFRVLIGVISVGFVLWQIARSRRGRSAPRAPWPAWVGAVAGMVAGFTSFVSHAGGPPAAVYMLRQGLSKLQFQATTVLLFWAVNLAKAVPYAMLGLFSLDSFKANLVLAPFGLLGAWIGVKLHHAVSERLFFGLTYALLTVTGAKLIWDGLT